MRPVTHTPQPSRTSPRKSAHPTDDQTDHPTGEFDVGYVPEPDDHDYRDEPVDETIPPECAEDAAELAAIPARSQQANRFAEVYTDDDFLEEFGNGDAAVVVEVAEPAPQKPAKLTPTQRRRSDFAYVYAPREVQDHQAWLSQLVAETLGITDGDELEIAIDRAVDFFFARLDGLSKVATSRVPIGTEWAAKVILASAAPQPKVAVTQVETPAKMTSAPAPARKVTSRTQTSKKTETQMTQPTYIDDVDTTFDFDDDAEWLKKSAPVMPRRSDPRPTSLPPYRKGRYVDRMRAHNYFWKRQYIYRPTRSMISVFEHMWTDCDWTTMIYSRPIGELAANAGISRSNVILAIDKLLELHVIERVTEGAKPRDVIRYLVRGGIDFVPLRPATEHDAG